MYGLSRANFVGVNDNGFVAVYQGVPWNLPFGIHLYREVYTSPLLAAELSAPTAGSSSTTRCADATDARDEITDVRPLRGGSAVSYRNRELDEPARRRA